MLFLKRYCSVSLRYSLHPNSRRNLNVLGIESSCDDTGVAIVDNRRVILGECINSQNKMHVKYGGINPTFAHELHRESIELCVKETLDKANLNWGDIDAIAVTVKPGLLLSLKVGVNYANYLAKRHKKPILPIHHMEAHALVARMYHNIPFPFITLLLSGGHCLLAIAKNVDNFLLLGKSLDNSPGEVLDKVARRMKLKNVPEYANLAGGYALELAARKSENPNNFVFPIPLLKIRDCNFSFSGLQASVLRKLINKETEHQILGSRVIPEVNDLSAAFLLAMTEHIVHRTERALHFSEHNNLINACNRNIVVSGGVACNNVIFKCVQDIGEKLGYKVYRPPARLCTDNGVMIAWNGVEQIMTYGNNKFTSKVLDSSLEPLAMLGTDLTHLVLNANLPVKSPKLNKKVQFK